MARKLPSFQFYPGDWMKDPNLRRCSPAARGVWIDMLCLMFECDERGVLASGGEPWTREEIACAVGGAQDVALSCIDELVRKGVARCREDGALYSARLVRDEQQRQGTNRRVREHRSKRNGDVTRQKRQCTEDEGAVEDEARSGSGGSKGAREPPPGFVRWWKAYPGRKTDKPRCVAIWRGERPMADGAKRKLEPLADEICGAVEAQRKANHWRSKDGRDYIPNASTWLYNGRWQDEVAEPSGAAASPLRDLSADELERLKRAAIKRWPKLESQPRTSDQMRKAMAQIAREGCSG